ncbi:MAG: hypothetical protein ACOVQ0_06640 [Novosphingobium sp.]|uniref:hypothetical protein n=1 Tax=Novosphingobium sp. TaxID=1874826 RepID=UPI003B9BEB2A
MSKRLLACVGDKGGSGKSTKARGLSDILRREGGKTFISDADGGVGQLAQFYGTRKVGSPTPEGTQDGFIGCHYWDIREESQRDALWECVDSGADTILIDFPGGAMQMLKEIDEATGFIDHAKSKGYEITFMMAMTPMGASVASVGRAIRLFGETGAKFAVAKNRFYGPQDDDWPIWDSSRAKKALEDVNGAVFDLPAMRMRSYALVDQANQGFTEFSNSSAQKTVDRSVVFQWLRKLEAEVSKLRAGGFL